MTPVYTGLRQGYISIIQYNFITSWATTGLLQLWSFSTDGLLFLRASLISYSRITSDIIIRWLWHGFSWSFSSALLCVERFRQQSSETQLFSRWLLLRPGAKTIKKNTNSTPNKSQTHCARAYKVISFLSTDCELSTETCSKNVYSLGPMSQPSTDINHLPPEKLLVQR